MAIYKHDIYIYYYYADINISVNFFKITNFSYLNFS